MSLLKPTIGEMLDRKIILSMKMINGAIKGLDVKPWKEEYEALESAIKLQLINDDKDTGIPIDLELELKSVNGILWQLEDEIRRYIKAGNNFPICSAAIAIVTTNDKRMNIIKQINAVFGQQADEKVYS